MSDVVPLLKFTPSAQDPQVLETITVQREPLVARLVEVALDAEGARHQLLIGPRGIGKTHLLSLVANRVRREADPGAVTFAWMEEDPWGIGSYEKFLAAILSGIAEERSDPALQVRADELHATRDESGRLGEEALRQAVGTSRLVLLVENLDDIFLRIGDNGQERFRAFVEDWQQLLIIATAQQLFEGVQRHASPFYGFFAITRLEELSLDSATELMRRIAELRGDKNLVRFLRSDVARRRLAAVEALAGGHPRIWLLLSGCVSIDAIDELVPLFLEALDDLTPYYQDRLRELGVQQQELVVQLSEAGGALSNRALSERSGIAQNQVATILGQLAERGYVRRAEVPGELASGDARLSYWELREPLMRLCLDVKQARGKPLRMVVEFLRAWYGPRLLDELMALPPTAELANTYVSEAFRSLTDTLPSQDVLRGSPEEILARAETGLSADPERHELQVAKAAALLSEERFQDARDFLEACIPKIKSESLGLGLELQLLHAREGLGEVVDQENMVRALLSRAEEYSDAIATQGFAAIGLAQLGRHREALGPYERALQLSPDDAKLLAGYGRSLAELNQLDEAREAFDRALALTPDDAEILARLGIVLRRIGDFGAAVQALDKAIALAPGSTDYRRFKGTALDDAGDHAAALQVFEDALELGPSDAKLHRGMGVALYRLHRNSEAVAAFAEASRLNPDDVLALEIQGLLMVQLGRLEEAEEALRRAIDVGSDSVWALGNRASILRRLGRFEEAEQVALGAIEGDPLQPLYRFALVEIAFARDDFAGGVRCLREALEVWSEKRETAPGDVEFICARLWDRWDDPHRDGEVVDRIVEAYAEAGAAESLGRALVKSVGWFPDPDVPSVKVEAWVDAWAGAREVEDLQIPLRILKAAAAWKKDQDRAHLLALPPEQREILIGLLAPQDDDDDES